MAKHLGRNPFEKKSSASQDEVIRKKKKKKSSTHAQNGVRSNAACGKVCHWAMNDLPLRSVELALKAVLKVKDYLEKRPRKTSSAF